MNHAQPTRLTVDEFLVWNEDNPGRFELVDGRLYAMSPERLRHAETRGLVFVALRGAVARSSRPCKVFPDGVTVRIDAATAFEPDALVRCGPPLDGDAIEVPDPVIVVEILSPGLRNYDAGAKLIGYFAVASIQHYLILDPIKRVVVHCRRDGADIATRILGAGVLHLDPPGLDVLVEDLFAAE